MEYSIITARYTRDGWTNCRKMLKLMDTLTNDARFEDTANKVIKEGGSTTMCKVLDEVEARGKAKGLLEGRLRTFFELVSDGLLSIADAAKKANLSESEFAQKLEQYKADL